MNQGVENQNIENDKNHENFLRKVIVVHTMPKGFKKVDSVGDGNHTSAGFFVMIGGLVLLIVLGFLSYYLVVKKDFFSLNKKSAIIEEKLASIDEVIKEPEAKIATSSIDNKASSTAEKIATSTFDSSLDDFGLSTSSLNIDDIFATSTGESSVIDVWKSSSSTDEEDLNDRKKEIVAREATDTDADALSDLEETLLGTNANIMDTDGDGFSDFQELDKMYDPVGKGSLVSNKAIASYLNPTYKYSLIHPATWVPTNFDKDESVMFKIDGLQFVQILIQSNPDKQTIEDWYRKQYGVEVIDELQKITNKQGWSGIVSSDGLNYFLNKDGFDDIYVISYNLGISNSLNYQKLFEMMVNSLDVTN